MSYHGWRYSRRKSSFAHIGMVISVLRLIRMLLRLISDLTKWKT